MIRNILKPCFKQSFLGTIKSYATIVDKASLSKLRKKTGIGFMNCRKALEQFENDIDKAEKWLLEQAQKEGWAKATKLQGRPMSQGLVGVMSDNQRATVVEINCETDFVAKNEKFQDLVSQITSGCHRYFMAAPSSTQRNHISLGYLFLRKILMPLILADNQNVSDLVAMTVGKVGENVSARRVTHIGVAPNSHLETYIHATGSDIEVDGCRMGKYAVLLDVSQDGSEEVGPLKTVAKQLCQHILGLKPNTVGDFENDKPLADRDDQPAEESDTSDDESDDSDDESDSDEEEKISKSKEEETRLVFQEFLFDPEIVVGEYLKENRATVNKFVRIECGAELPSES
ncbi:elongation factor Ts, mitochondrial-like [Pecten maximus]|uniref:elongation factor Ts, mitochondrial-like n=1 Tax=Pecten maximus TaxID=6579 RepID=UPI001458F40C|nr:elongation factor Ts, mitochondrial-like [Pecten maximus]